MRARRLWTRNNIGPLYAAGLFLTYALVILAHPLPPFLGDFADWVYQGVLLARHWQGVPDTGHALKHYPVPNSTATVLLGLFAALLPWAAAAKAFLLLQLALAWFAIRALARAAGTSSWIWFVAPGCFFLNVNFWFGLIAFQLGMALLFFFVALILQNEQGRAADVKRSAFLLLLFFTHMVPFTFACLLLLCRALLTRRTRPVYSILPSALLLTLYAVLRWRAGNPDEEVVPRLPFGTLSFYATFKINTILKSFRLVNPGDLQDHSLALWLLSRFGFAAVLLANLLVCAIVLSLFMAAMRRHWSSFTKPRRLLRDSGPRSALWLAILLCIPVYLLLPRAILGMSDPGSRVLQVALWVGLFLCTGRPFTTRLLASASVATAAAGLLLFTNISFRSVALQWPPVPAHSVRRLALVPYASVAGFYDALRLHDFATPVFPTGLFTNTARSSSGARQSKGPVH